MERILISVVIPARNEERYLPACLESIARAWEYLNSRSPSFDLEKIVVINRCTDATEQIARNSGCRIVPDDTKNLSHIRNSGVREALGEFVITIDADSRMGAAMLYEVVRALSNINIVGGGVMMLPERWSLGIFLTMCMLLPLVLRHKISGGLFFFRRSDFFEIGGFNEELHSAEDVEFAVRLKKHGRATARRFHTIIRSLLITSCRKFDTLGDWYFVLRPREVVTLLGGKDRALADKIWYDFKR